MFGRSFSYCAHAYPAGTEAWALQRALLGPGRALRGEPVIPAARGGCAHCAVTDARSGAPWVAMLALVVAIALRSGRTRMLAVTSLGLLASSPGVAQDRVALGASHACFLHDGRVACFGSSATGPTPAIVPLDDVVAVGAGLAHSCALRADGTVWCWGGNAHGQSGARDAIAPFASVTTPTRIDIEGATEISVGAMHACALTSAGRVLCWGGNVFGELGRAGDGGPEPVELPVSAARRVTTGLGVTCVDPADGARQCFGRDVAPVGAAFAAGIATTCDATAAVACEPTELGGLLGTVDVGAPRDIAVVGATACVAGTMGAACAGWPSVLVPRAPDPIGPDPRTDEVIGELGGDRSRLAVRVSDRGTREVALGWNVGCLGRDDGTWCWGWDAEYAAGLGLEVQEVGARDVVELAGRPSAYVCARTSSGEVSCGDRPRTMAPIAGLPPSTAIAASGRRGCAIARDRTAWCWSRAEPAPAQVRDLASVTAIGVGADHACAIADGDVWCWGANELGQANDASTETRIERPSRVERARDAVALALEDTRSSAIGPAGERVWWGGSRPAAPPPACAVHDGLVTCGDYVVPIARPEQLLTDEHGVCARGADGRAGCSNLRIRAPVWPPRRVPLELWLGRR